MSRRLGDFSRRALLESVGEAELSLEAVSPSGSARGGCWEALGARICARWVVVLAGGLRVPAKGCVQSGVGRAGTASPSGRALRGFLG